MCGFSYSNHFVFTKDNNIPPRNRIAFCGEPIDSSDTVINLALRMDRNLNWTGQVNDVPAKVFGTSRTLRRFAPVLITATRKKLVQAIIMPFFTYGDVVYYNGLSMALKEQLNRCFKASVRFVNRIRRRESTAAVRDTILGHDLPQNYNN